MKRTIYLMICTLLSVQLFAQQQPKPAQGYSLKEAVDYAKKYNQTIQNSRLDEQLSAKKIKETRSIGLPQVSGEGRFAYSPQIPVIGIPNTNGMFGPDPLVKFPQGIDYSITSSINASQLLFDGSFFMGLKAAKEFSLLSRYNTKKTEYDVETDVIRAYCMVLTTEESIKLTESNILTIEKTRNDLKALAEQGLVEQTDFDRIDLSYSNLVLLRQQLHDARYISYYSLKLQMGMNVRDSISLTDDLNTLYTATAGDPDFAQQLDYNKRPEYQMLTQQQKMHELDKKRHQFGYAPSLAAFFQHQQNAFGVQFRPMFNQFYPGTFVGLNLRVPIFDGFDKNAKVQQVKINIEKTERSKNQLENAMELEVLSARTTYTRSKEHVLIQQKNLALAQDIYKRINLKYQNGLSSSLDVVTTEKDLTEAQNNYLNAIYDMLIARATLKKALGQ
jgi:outer membrane protein